MMRAATSAEIAALDRRATDTYGIPVAHLMDQAGRRVAQAAVELLGGRQGRVAVLAGKGNNGGDGFVAARYLRSRGIPVTLILAAPSGEYTGDAGQTMAEATAAGAQTAAADSVALADFDLVIDALFGTGFRGPARDAARILIEAANASGIPILAVDIPSGLNADTGQPEGPVIRAAATVTMGLPKVGLLIYPGVELAGTLYVADIGYPPELADDASLTTHLVTADMVRAKIPPRPPDSHKGTYGTTLVVAGSVGFTGAAVLAALGALRTGAGLVTLAVPQAIYPIVAAHVVEAMPTPLNDEGGALAAGALARVEALAARSDVVAVGPGLSTAPGVRRVVDGVLRTGKPIVIDADALNVLAGDAQVLRRAEGPVVITPHPGELGRLIGKPTPEIVADRLGEARAAADQLQCTVVLKSASTVIATPEGQAFIVLTGNAGMATGGMGDVLTGAIASLIGQGADPVDASWMAAYLHGLAADILAGERGMIGMLASEVAHHLPVALARLQRGEPFDTIRELRD